MNKCIFCKNKCKGKICNKCLAKGSANARKCGEGLLKVAKVAIPIVIAVISKGKIKPKK
ncbi:MAG: hypothetical protein ACRC28_02550 [Clostridium sp.]|uniref:hypothetical protein n=1 Tax=Clostridium sp. TaxID=1506 RepID=UPI003F350E61